MDKVLLIDGRNAVFRASVLFGADPNIPVENVIVYNFFRNLRPIVELFSPDKIFFALEGHPKFRYELYADYKADRLIKTGSSKDTVDNVNVASEIIHKLLRYFPITMVKADNYEADDVIATLCSGMTDEDCTILSSDSDYMQLLQKYSNIKVYDPRKKQYLESEEYNYVLFKSLTGGHDNLNKLLKPKKVTECCFNPEKLKQFLSIEENRANFSINKKLVEFADVPIDELIIIEGKKDFDKVKEEFNWLEFPSITNEKSWEKFTRTFDCVKL